MDNPQNIFESEPTAPTIGLSDYHFITHALSSIDAELVAIIHNVHRIGLLLDSATTFGYPLDTRCKRDKILAIGAAIKDMALIVEIENNLLKRELGNTTAAA